MTPATQAAWAFAAFWGALGIAALGFAYGRAVWQEYRRREQAAEAAAIEDWRGYRLARFAAAVDAADAQPDLRAADWQIMLAQQWQTSSLGAQLPGRSDWRNYIAQALAGELRDGRLGAAFWHHTDTHMLRDPDLKVSAALALQHPSTKED